MRLDGLHLTEYDTNISSTNINRFEQRVLRTKQQTYFRDDNCELKLDTKLFDEKIFKKTDITDISLTKNPFQETIKRNAVICERSNQKKDIYYLMEMYIGKLQIFKHPLFLKEEILAGQLEEKMAIYRDKIEEAAIPHYGQILQILKREYEVLCKNPDSPDIDIVLINKQIIELKRKVEEEKESLQILMDSIYETWNDIKEERLIQKFTSTPHLLTVKEYHS